MVCERIYYINALDRYHVEGQSVFDEGASAIEWGDGRVTVRRTECNVELLASIGVSIPWTTAEFPSIKAVCAYFRAPVWRVQMTHVAADHGCEVCLPQQWLDDQGEVITNFIYSWPCACGGQCAVDCDRD
jgi:hypothetical protein